jgi:peptidylprolyl isomerase
VPFARLPFADPYAPETGFSGGFAVGRDPKRGRAWLAHCYATVGVGRDAAPGSGSGAELFAVIGHAPRHLDRNYTAVGRVLAGIEHLSTLPRGTEALGFYRTPSEHVPVVRIRMGTEVPATERLAVQVMRTEGPAFAAYVQARANRNRDGFLVGAGGVDVCNIRVPQRPAP